MTLRSFAAALFLVAACGSSPPPTTPATALSGTTIFCAPGGVGVLPDPLPPDYDAYYVVTVIDVDNPGPALTGVTVSGVELLKASGVPRAHMRKLEELGAFPATTTLPPLLSDGSWAVYADSKIPAFDGTLAPGHTRLRIRAWIDVPAVAAANVRVTIGNADQQVVIDGPVMGAFPS